MLRVLTDRGTEYCGQREHHEYELDLAVENIDHSCTKSSEPIDEWSGFLWFAFAVVRLLSSPSPPVRAISAASIASPGS